ncbi:Biflaviolin synthase CYP158A2 [Streptomyces sp. RB5]|uniref:Biflaviolin synthase CYP158A2 n=1 Tax=Streptomyces smaragdinus TaxID=2585196 RepID=A0A7K0CM96_9ACTN|nr:cytochrome P450 [Streptomyces smaragdinus]MQY14600.1 Biflaviolin synthase CYP158A2 [Streptomyces smaragdinus]
MITYQQTRPPVRVWPALDLHGVDFDPVLTELMEEGPITRIELPNGTGWAWLVTRYEDVKAVTNDDRFSREAVVPADVTRLAPHFIPVPGAVGFADPPDHTRLRRAVAAAFTKRGVERLRHRTQEILEDLVDPLLRDGPPADFTERLLVPFPLAVVCEVMGVPAADQPRMHEWTYSILSSSKGADRSEEAKNNMAAYFTELLRERGSTGGDDVCGLLGAAVARSEVSEEEAVGLALLIQIGGEAVTNNSGNMIYILLTRPELADRLRAEPELRARGVDELLRYIPHRSAVGLSRVAKEDVELCGVTIKAGEAVYNSYLAANRDPDVFPDPGAIDLQRSPNPHLAFGHGPHYCVGGLLATMESQLLISTVLDRFPGLRLTVPPEEVPFRRGALIRGPEALPVTW